MQSFIRSGNHFIKPPPDHYLSGRWLLIDGPWYDYLERFECNPVALYPYLVKDYFFPSPDDCPPVFTETIGDLVVWRKLSVRLWYTTMPNNIRLKPRFAGNLIVTTKVIEKVVITDAYTCEDGVVPCHIRCKKWDERITEAIEFWGDR